MSIQRSTIFWPFLKHRISLEKKLKTTLQLWIIHFLLYVWIVCVFFISFLKLKPLPKISIVWASYTICAVRATEHLLSDQRVSIPTGVKSLNQDKADNPCVMWIRVLICVCLKSAMNQPTGHSLVVYHSALNMN